MRALLGHHQVLMSTPSTGDLYAPPGVPPGTINLTPLFTITGAGSAIQWTTGIYAQNAFPYPMQTGPTTFFNGAFTNPATNPILQITATAASLSALHGVAGTMYVYINGATGNTLRWRYGYSSGDPLQNLSDRGLLSKSITISASNNLGAYAQAQGPGATIVPATPLPFISFAYVGFFPN